MSFHPRLLILLAGLLLLGCLRVDMGAVKTLKDLGEDEKAKEEFIAKEEAHFQNVRQAIARRQLKRGWASSEVESQFGPPVLILPEGAEQKWIYKSGEGHWFKAPKIHLFFDKEDRLARWQCLRTDCAGS